MQTRKSNRDKGARTRLKKARLYHLSEDTIKQIDILSALFGGKEAAVAGAVDATYRAAGAALRRLKVHIKIPAR